MEERVWREFTSCGNERQLGCGQRLLKMVKDFIGGQGPQRTVVHEEEKEEDEEEKEDKEE
jgi:hypothetical protein